jgi:short-subunit dehydrogenase
MSKAPAYQTALITGASSGIGEAFAHALAKDGSTLILVARSGDKLEKLAHQIRAKYQRRVEVITADLSKKSPGAALAAEVAKRDLQVDLLINNAGFGGVGAFHKQDAAREQQMIALNCAAIVDLCHAFLPNMLDRDAGGGIINIASLAAFQAVPYMSVYGATKAFVLSFSQALWAEYQKNGLRVLAVCPGPVETGFFEATGNSNLRKTVPNSVVLKPEDVVAQSLKALRANQTMLVPGMQAKAVAWTSKLMPRRLMAQMSARVMRRS